MEKLACGERIVRCLTGRPVDRIPFGIGLGWSAWAQTLERWRAETKNPELNPGVELGIAHIHIWEDMSGKQGSLLSPAMVRGFMMPCYERIAAFAKETNIPLISVDTDGNCSELVPIMMEHGVNMIFPFEVQAGNNILDYRRKYPELGIMFGLDKRALAAGKDAINRELEKARQMARLGRYIPGFDHSIPPDVPWKNFRYAAEHIREICREI